MSTFKELEDSLRNFILQEQSDAHNIKTVNSAKYNNLKIWMDITKYVEPHIFVHLSISEAVFKIQDCSKLSGGLGYEERFISKWITRMGIKDKLMDLWRSAESARVISSKGEIRGSDTV